MNKKKLTKLFVIILVFAFASTIVQGAYSSYVKADSNHMINNQEQSPKAVEIKEVFDLNKKLEKSMPLEDVVKVKKTPKQHKSMGSAVMAKEIETSIKQADIKNGDKNINKYKKLLTELDIPKKFEKEITKQIKSGSKISDVFTAYEFLYHNYGQLEELQVLLNEKTSGKKWAQIFKEYSKNHKKFIPRKFEAGYLESLMQESDLNIDDIMNADRISQKGLETFEKLVMMKKQGKSWKSIKTELGIINTSERLPRIAITRKKVKKHLEKGNLTENQVIDALVISEKFGIDELEVIESVKAGHGNEDIYAKYYNNKYR